MIAEMSQGTTRAQMRPRYAGLKLLSILAASLFLLVVAGTWSVESMFTMSACLMVLPLVSIAVCRIWLSGLKCRREPLDPMVEGEVREVTVTLRQRYFTDLTVRVWDLLPRGLRSDTAMPAVASLSGISSRFHYSVEARKRGVYEIGPLKVGVHDPLGIIGMARRFGGQAAVIVYPKPLVLTSWMLVSGDAPSSPFAVAAIRAVTPSGTDFHGTRKYYPGDDLRRVHWKSAARARELIVSEYQEESAPQDVVIVLDTQRGTEVGLGDETTLDYAARAAAHIAESALEKGGRVALITGSTSGVSEELQGIGQLRVILEELARAQADSPRSLAEVLSASAFVPGSAVAVISSKVDDDLRDAARDLLAGGVNVAQVYVDPESFGDEPTIDSGRSALLHADIPCWRVTKGAGDGD